MTAFVCNVRDIHTLFLIQADDSTSAGWAIGNFGYWPTVPWLQTTWQYVRPFLADLVKRYPTKGGIYLSEFGFAEPYENE